MLHINLILDPQPTKVGTHSPHIIRIDINYNRDSYTLLATHRENYHIVKSLINWMGRNCLVTMEELKINSNLDMVKVSHPKLFFKQLLYNYNTEYTQIYKLLISGEVSDNVINRRVINKGLILKLLLPNFRYSNSNITHKLEAYHMSLAFLLERFTYLSKEDKIEGLGGLKTLNKYIIKNI